MHYRTIHSNNNMKELIVIQLILSRLPLLISVKVLDVRSK